MEEASRQDREIRTYQFLNQLGIPYTSIDHAPAMTMEDCLAIDQQLQVRMCKNLFLCNRQQTQFYLLMMPGDKKFRTKDLSAQLGVSRLSFADEGFLLKYLDIHPGSVSVLGLMNDQQKAVQLLVDQELLQDAFIGCHPCVNTSSLRIAREDLFGKFLSAVGHDYRVVALPKEEG